VTRHAGLLLLALAAMSAAGSSSPGQAPGGQDVAAAVAGLERRYQSVVSASARFTQTYRAPGIEQVESGVMYLKKPGLMRWEYRVPETKLFVADGKKTYLYTPGDRQVMVSPFGPRELRATPLEFLLGQGSPARSFRAAPEGEIRPRVERTALVRLYPRSPLGEYEFVTVEYDEATFDLRRLVIRETSGATSEFDFSELRLNAPVEARQFEFKIPRGVEVIQVDDK
jgi:outer membrane lipoprotein carrier protein